MAFGRKIAKEDLKDAGLDLDDLTTRLSTIPNDEKIKTIVSGSVADTVKSSLADLEQRMTSQFQEIVRTASRGNNNNNNNNNNNDENGNSNGNDEVSDMDFVTDPVKHTTEIVRRQTEGLQLQTIKIGADFAYNNAKNTFSYFNIPAIEEEVRKEWEKYPIKFKTQPDVLIKNIYDMVVGRHLDEIRTDSNKREGKYNVVQSGGTTHINTPNQPTTKPEDNLTSEELKAAKNFDMTAEDYAKFKGTTGVRYV